MPEPYSVLGSENVLRNPFLSVRADQIRLGDRNGVHYVIELPRAATVVPVLPDGRVVMIRQYRHSVGEVLLELPAGRVDHAETPEAAAARELTEETGYTAGRMLPLGRFIPLSGLSDHIGWLFEARDLVQGPPKREAFEDLETVLLTPTELVAALESGQIVDGFCLVAVFRFLMAHGLLKGAAVTLFHES